MYEHCRRLQVRTVYSYARVATRAVCLLDRMSPRQNVYHVLLTHCVRLLSVRIEKHNALQVRVAYTTVNRHDRLTRGKHKKNVTIFVCDLTRQVRVYGGLARRSMYGAT